MAHIVKETSYCIVYNYTTIDGHAEIGETYHSEKECIRVNMRLKTKYVLGTIPYIRIKSTFR
jgi:hypothetical protein